MFVGSAAVLVIVAAIGGLLYYRSRQAPRLTDKDTIVIADFANSTSDAVFDNTLKTALTVALTQSPFLNVLSDNQVAQTLKLMTRPAGTKLTPDVARELCLRSNSNAYIAGSIDSLGSEYVLGLKGVNCHSGEPLAQEQVTASGKENVLNALGDAAAKLRGRLGESLASVQKFDVPLAQATTSSLEALQAYTAGLKSAREKDYAAALPYYQRAIQLDPNFAVAYVRVGGAYTTMSQEQRAAEYFAKAYELREHASERENLLIASRYYENVSGELDKAAQIYQEMTENYPRVHSARELTKRASESAIRADSKETGAIWWENAALREAAMGNFADARQAAAEGTKLDPASSAVAVQPALTYAMVGDSARAQSMAKDLDKRYPLNTQMQSLWLPAINAQLALNRKHPAEAITALQPSLPPIEYGQIWFMMRMSCLYPTYIRGQSYLAAGQGTAAGAEFQKILDHSGVVWNCWTGVLARLGVARANALQAKNSQGADADAARVRALAAYKDFLTLWKDADPDIPIYRQAKAEYARLR